MLHKKKHLSTYAHKTPAVFRCTLISAIPSVYFAFCNTGFVHMRELYICHPFVNLELLQRERAIWESVTFYGIGAIRLCALVLCWKQKTRHKVYSVSNTDCLNNRVWSKSLSKCMIMCFSAACIDSGLLWFGCANALERHRQFVIYYLHMHR